MWTSLIQLTCHIFNLASSVLGFTCFARLFCFFFIFLALFLAHFPLLSFHGNISAPLRGLEVSDVGPWVLKWVCALVWSVCLGLRYTGHCVIVIPASATHSTSVILKMSKGPWEVNLSTFISYKPSLGIFFKLNKNNGKRCPWTLKLGWEQRAEGC